MSRPIWKYDGPHKGDYRWFWAETALDTKRPDWTCENTFRPKAFYVDKDLAPVDPLIGHAPWFRVKFQEFYDIPVTCSSENNPDSFGEHCFAWFDVFRRSPFVDTPDTILLNLDWLNHIQFLPDGGIVRWLRWPPAEAIGGWITSTVDWIAWRAEYPDGRIIDLAPEEWWANTANPYHADITKARGKPASRSPQGDGSVILLDGAGRPMMRLLPTGGFSLFALGAGPDWRTIHHVRPWLESVQRFEAGGWSHLEFPGFVLDADFFSGLRGSLAGKEWIRNLAPSDVIGIYYGLGDWVDVVGGRRHQPTYEAKLFPGRKGAIFAALEGDLRRRIYDWRPDLHVVNVNGERHLGLLPWFLFPPLGGLPCFQEERSTWWTQALSIAGTIMLSTIPGIGGLIASVGVTYAQMKDKAKALAAQMKAMEEAGLMAQIAGSAATGAGGIVSGNAVIDGGLLDRANGTQGGTPQTGSKGVLVLAALAALSVLG